MTDLYQIGDAIGGARIVSIRKDAVILSENGLKKILKLDVSRPRSAAGSAKQEPAKSETKPVPVPSRSVRRIQVLEEILEKAVIEPAVEKNQTIGLRIRELDEVPMAKALGLQEGDIIHIVNGQELSSKQKAFQVFRKAKVQPEILLELTRDGKRETLGFSLR
jgi:type II secretion system protein C